MKLFKYLNDWIEPPKHYHETEGRFGLDHPKAKKNLPEYTLCVDPTCAVYERKRREAVLKAFAVTAVWFVTLTILALVARGMK